MVPPNEDIEAFWGAVWNAYYQGALRDEDLLLAAAEGERIRITHGDANIVRVDAEGIRDHDFEHGVEALAHFETLAGASGLRVRMQIRWRETRARWLGPRLGQPDWQTLHRGLVR